MVGRYQQARKRPAREPNLYPSYGLWHATTAAVDTLILVFAAKIVDISSRQLGLMDGANNFGYVVAAVALGIYAARVVRYRSLLVAGVFLTAIPILLFSLSGQVWVAFLLAVLEGAFLAIPNSAAPLYLCARLPRHRWGEVYGKLSAASAAGGGIGMVFSFLWLLGANHWMPGGAGEHSLFVVLGVATLLAGLAAWKVTGGRLRPRDTAAAPSSGGVGHSLVARVKALASSTLRLPLSSAVQRPPASIFRDVWVGYYGVSSLLYLGLGMSFTGALLYMINVLDAPGALLLVAVLAFRAASWVVSPSAGRVVGWLTPMRLQQGAGVWRVVAVGALSLVALLPSGPWSLVMVILLFFLSGTTSGVLGVTGLAAAMEAVPSRYHGLAVFMFNGLSTGAVGIGALAAGVIAQSQGFPFLLALSGLMIGAALWLSHRY